MLLVTLALFVGNLLKINKFEKIYITILDVLLLEN